jgi:hypothetical protein
VQTLRAAANVTLCGASVSLTHATISSRMDVIITCLEQFNQSIAGPPRRRAPGDESLSTPPASTLSGGARGAEGLSIGMDSHFLRSVGIDETFGEMQNIPAGGSRRRELSWDADLRRGGDAI